MPGFDPRQFLELADDLSAPVGTTEAALRTSVGRAYYAAFLVARDRLGAIPLLSPEDLYDRPDVHGKVVQTVKGKKSGLGDKLNKLRRLRQQADYVLSSDDSGYRPEYANWAKNSSDARTIAKSIITHLVNLS